MARELSTKWYNVLRREMSRTRVTYAGDPPACPNCLGSMMLAQGRYGRFYLCEGSLCHGTVGAHLDGTPRRPRISPSHERARTAIRLYLDTWEQHKALEETPKWTLRIFEAESMDALLKRLAREVPGSGKTRRFAQVRAGASDDWPFTIRMHGLFLKHRTEAELVQIAQIADELRSKLSYGDFFDRLPGCFDQGVSAP